MRFDQAYVESGPGLTFFVKADLFALANETTDNLSANLFRPGDASDANLVRPGYCRFGERKTSFLPCARMSESGIFDGGAVCND
jgi:hypothetical protein